MRKLRATSSASSFVVEDLRVFLTCPQDARTLEGLSFVLHRLVSQEEENSLSRMIVAKYNENALEGVSSPQLNQFVFFMLQHSRLLSFDLLIDLKVALRKERPGELVDSLIFLIEQSLSRRSPVMSRWHSDPASDVLGWMAWSDDQIAASLNNLSLPFWQLRAHEFSLPFGHNLTHLNEIANSLSMFVAASILVGCVVSKTTGAVVASRWVKVCKLVLAMGNFHILFAIHCGMQKHQVERVPVSLFAGREKTFKKEMDDLFNPCDRFETACNMWTNRAMAREPTVLCVFWLVQKATLLEESPLHQARNFNVDAFHAAYNTFHVLHLAQSIPPLPLDARLSPECSWYFLEVARSFKARENLEERLYALSDKLKLEQGPDHIRSNAKSMPKLSALSRSRPDEIPRRISLGEILPEIVPSTPPGDGPSSMLQVQQHAKPKHHSSAPVLATEAFIPLKDRTGSRTIQS